MNSRESSLNTAACRLVLNIMPGLETTVLFKEKASTVCQQGFSGWCEGLHSSCKITETRNNVDED